MNIFAKSDAQGGGIVAYHNDEESYQRHGEPPPGTWDQKIEIDFETNPNILRAMHDHIEEFTVIGGQLKRNGSNVTVSGDGENTRHRRRIDQALALLDDDSMTLSQMRRLLAAMIRRMRRRGSI